MLSQQMNQSRPVYVERESAQLERILQCYHQIPTGIIKNGNMIGYLLKDNESKSISELELLNVQDLNKVLKAYFVEFPVEKTEIYMPDYQVRYMRTLGEIAESYRKSESNMYNILDFADVIEAFLKLKFFVNGLTHGVWSAIMGEQPVTITVTADGVSVERRADAGAVRLSKMEAQTLILTPFGRFLKTNVPNDWFPLPIYWATVDSF